MDSLILLVIKAYISYKLFTFGIVRILYVIFDQDVASLAYAVIAFSAIYLIWAFEDFKQAILNRQQKR